MRSNFAAAHTVPTAGVPVRPPPETPELPIPNAAKNEGSGLEVYHHHHNFSYYGPGPQQQHGYSNFHPEIESSNCPTNPPGLHPVRPNHQPLIDEGPHNPYSKEQQPQATGINTNSPEDREATGGSPSPHNTKKRRILGIRPTTLILPSAVILLTISLCLLAGVFSTRLSALEELSVSIPSSPTSSAAQSPPSESSPTSSTTTQSPPSPPPPATTDITVLGWTFLGCYYNQATNQALKGKGNTSYKGEGNGMSNAVCARHCSLNAKPYFGTSSGDTCYCGDEFAPPAVPDGFAGRAPDWKCNSQCKGVKKSNEACGGYSVLSVWKADAD